MRAFLVLFLALALFSLSGCVHPDYYHGHHRGHSARISYCAHGHEVGSYCGACRDGHRGHYREYRRNDCGY